METSRKSITVLIALGLALAAPAAGQVGGYGNSGGPVGSGGFGGPAILSRGTGAVGRNGGRATKLTYHIGAGSFYSSGLTTPLGTSDDRYGVMAHGGLVGSYAGQRSWGSISWGGSMNYYRGGKLRVTPNHGGALTYGRVLSRSWTLHSSVASRSNDRQLNPFGAGLGTNFSDDPTAELSDPTGELFDSRSFSISGALGTTYQMSRRVAISLSTGASFQRFSSGALIGSNAFSGSASTAYILNSKSSIGGSFRSSQFYFPGRYGESFVMSAHAFYSRAITSRWRVNFSVGPYRVDSTRLVRVQIDPFIAALIGQSSFQEIFNRVGTGVSGRVTVSGRLGKSGVSLGYGSSITPGNGVLLTSSQGSSSFGYTFTGTRRWNYGFNATYSRAKSLILTTAPAYQAAGANFGASCRLNDFMALTMGTGYYHSFLSNSSFKTDRVAVSVGLSFSPGTIPLPLF